MELGFWIPILGFGIQSPGFSISRAKLFPDSGSHKQKFTGLRNPDSLKSGDILKAGAIVTLSVKAGGYRHAICESRGYCHAILEILLELFLKIFNFFLHQLIAKNNAPDL